jgi:HK97 family phage major capsid protein
MASKMSLEDITAGIRRLARVQHRSPAQNAQFGDLCRQSKAINEAARITRSKSPDRAVRRSAMTSRRAMAADLAAEQRQAAAAMPAVRTAPKVIDPTRAHPHQLRDAALAIVEREEHRLTPAQADHLEMMLRESDDHRDATTVAKWVCMTENPNYRSAFFKSMRSHAPVFTGLETFAVNRFREEFASEMRAATESGSFGLAIPATIDPSIIPSAQELAPIVQLCTTVTIMTNVYKGVASVGSAWGFSAEGTVIADETPVLVQPNVPIYTAKSFVPASIELTMDYPDFPAEITKTLARGYADLLSQKSAIGSGTGEPTGLFTALANTTTNPSHISVSTAGHIGAVDVRAAWSALPQRFRANATWVMHENVLSQVRNIDGAAAQVDLIVDRQGTSLMGRPVVTSSYCPDFTGTTGSENYLVVGDLSGYALASRLGVQVELVPTMRDVTGRPVGQRGFLAYARLGMDVTVPPAFNLLANS